MLVNVKLEKMSLVSQWLYLESQSSDSSSVTIFQPLKRLLSLTVSLFLSFLFLCTRIKALSPIHSFGSPLWPPPARCPHFTVCIQLFILLCPTSFSHRVYFSLSLPNLLITQFLPASTVMSVSSPKFFRIVPLTSPLHLPHSSPSNPTFLAFCFLY